MITELKSIFWTSLLGAAFAAGAHAAPKLKLLQTVLPAVTVAAGGSANISVDAKNTGDGSLNLQVTSSAPWITPIVGASHNCSDNSGPGCLPIQISIQASSLAAGEYAGFVTANDPNAIDAPQTVQVSIQIVTGVPAKIEAWVNVGGAASLQFSVASSATVKGTTANWLTVAQNGGSPFSLNLPYAVTLNSGGLAVGDYSGSVTVTGSSTASDNKTIAVTMHVVAQPISGPLSSIGGALNNTTYAVGEALAQGDIVALFGSQFITGDPVGASSLPLSTTLGGVQLSLNGQPVPLYYVSAGQINFQIPFSAATGAGALQVSSNGTMGNIISVQIAKAVPRILRLGGSFADYGIVVNADNSLAIPSALGGIPAKVGGSIVIYAIGLGPTSPAVDSGAGAPSSPLAYATDNPKVCFTASSPFINQPTCVTPAFAGLTPGFVGLYQINVAIPAGTPTGDVPIRLSTTDGDSNTVNISVH